MNEENINVNKLTYKMFVPIANLGDFSLNEVNDLFNLMYLAIEKDEDGGRLSASSCSSPNVEDIIVSDDIRNCIVYEPRNLQDMTIIEIEPLSEVYDANLYVHNNNDNTKGIDFRFGECQIVKIFSKEEMFSYIQDILCGEVMCEDVREFTLFDYVANNFKCPTSLIEEFPIQFLNNKSLKVKENKTFLWRKEKAKQTYSLDFIKKYSNEITNWLYLLYTSNLDNQTLEYVKAFISDEEHNAFLSEENKYNLTCFDESNFM